MNELDRLRSILSPTGPGHSLDDLEKRGFKRAEALALLRELSNQGRATRVGCFWWAVMKIT